MKSLLIHNTADLPGKGDGSIRPLTSAVSSSVWESKTSGTAPRGHPRPDQLTGAASKQWITVTLHSLVSTVKYLVSTHHPLSTNFLEK